MRKRFGLDTHLDVSRRSPNFFPELEALVKSGKVQLLVSEIVLTEILEGDHLATFHDGVARPLSLSPTWVFLTGLATRDVQYEYALYRGLPATEPFLTFTTWSDFLPLIATDEERANCSGELEIPTADALLV